MRKTVIRILTILLGLSIGVQAIAQSRTIKGIVSSAEGAEVGVYVFQKGHESGATMTDSEGAYTIEVVGADPVLVFSMVGYKETSVSVGNRSTINVDLELDTTFMEEAVDVG